MKVKFFDPGFWYQLHKDEIDSEMQRVLKAGDLILRKDVEAFEANLAAYVGSKYAVALNSCTDALYLALRYLNIGPGDEVLVPSRTFVATVQVIVQCGATPIYIDTDGDFIFTERTKAIIPVHIEGAFGAKMVDLVKMCLSKNIAVIEDAAQALGAWQDGKRAGAFGFAGCFSFYPAKILGAFGDAGAVVTDQEDFYNWVKQARNHFKDTAEDWGVNSRMDNLQAAILNVKMKYLPEALERREEIACMYQEGLKNLAGLELPPHTDGRVWQDYIIRLQSLFYRDELYDHLKKNDIESLKNNYPFPVPKLPGAQKYEDETLRLPCNELLTDNEVQHIINKIKDLYVF